MGYFPYERMYSLEKLECTSLLPREAFYSQLKDTCVTVDSYTTMTCMSYDYMTIYDYDLYQIMCKISTRHYKMYAMYVKPR